MAGDLKTQLAVAVDGTGVTAGVENIKKSLDTLGQKAVAVGKQASDGIDGIGTGAGPTAAKIDAATRNMVGSIQRQIAAMEAGSKSGADYYRVLAGQRGIDTSALKPYLDQLDAITAKHKAAQSALGGTAPALDKVGVSAAQTAAAMRGVPAQFTDIITSLQGGQGPLTVFLQQGGQLKDMFGGAGAAARALSGYVVGLISPFTVAAGAGAAFALAMYQGSQQTAELNKALILTGGSIGKTTGDLQAMAAAIAQSNGSQAQASAALAAAVESGKVPAQSLRDVGDASVIMARVLGVSIEDAVGSFVKLADEPAKASAKLNEQYHYLSASTYQRIRDLEEQGRKEEAAGLAQSTYANATNERLRQVESQTSVLRRAWNLLWADVMKTWDAMEGIGRAKSTTDMLGDAQSRLAARQARSALPGTDAAYAKGLAKDQAEVAELSRKLLGEQERSYAQAERSRAETEKIAAIQRLADQKKATRSRADQRKDEIEQLDRDAKAVSLSKSEYDKRVSDINEKYKDAKGPKSAAAKAFQDDAGTKYLETLRQQAAVLQEQLSGAGKLSDAEREQAKFAQLIADIKGKDQLTAEQKSLMAARDKIAAQLQINVLTEREIAFQKILADDAKRRADAEKATANAVAGNRVRIADSMDRQREQADDRLGVIGMGGQAAEELRARQQVEREYARLQAQLTVEAARNATLEGEAYKQGTRDIAAARAQALGINADYYGRLREMQGDWSLGAAQAIANYRDESANVYKQVEQLTGNAFRGMEDALVSFATTGKLSFKSLANSIIADLVRIQVRASITSAIGGAGGGALSSLIGGITGGLSGSSAASLANVIGGDDKLGSMISLARYASGGVLSSQGLSAYSGRIVDKPTIFPFAKGAGLMGEAGPEAIMPLKRGADGKLGIAGGGGGDVQVNIQNNGAPATAQVKRTQTPDGGIRIDVMLEQIKDAIADDIANGAGSVSRSMEGRFGLRTAVN